MVHLRAPWSDNGNSPARGAGGPERWVSRDLLLKPWKADTSRPTIIGRCRPYQGLILGSAATQGSGPSGPRPGLPLVPPLQGE